MATAGLLSSLGLFIEQAFLSPEVCAGLRDEVRSVVAYPSVVRDGSDYVVAEDTRRTKWAEVSEDASRLVTERLLELKPRLETHFDLSLSGFQEPQFLIYREGDFFRQHKDRGSDPDAPAFSRERRLAAVVFLNSESREPSGLTYEGGSLTFYGLLDDEGLGGKSMGFPLPGEEGLLVAFPTDVVNEDTPVVRGERYTVVTWFV